MKKRFNIRAASESTIAKFEKKNPKNLSKSSKTPAKHRDVFAKNVTQQRGFELSTSCLPGRRTTNRTIVTRRSKLLFTNWSNCHA